MARINVDSHIFVDRRITELAHLLNCSVQRIRGNLLDVWHYCYENHTDMIPIWCLKSIDCDFKNYKKFYVAMAIVDLAAPPFFDGDISTKSFQNPNETFSRWFGSGFIFPNGEAPTVKIKGVLERIKNIPTTRDEKGRWKKPNTVHGTDHGTDNGTDHGSENGVAHTHTHTHTLKKTEDTSSAIASTPPVSKTKSNNSEVTDLQKQIVAHWNTHTDWKKCTSLEGRRLQKFNKRLKKFPDLSHWIRMIDLAATMPWPTGQVARNNQPPYRAPFDWLLEDGQFTRIEEEAVEDTQPRFY